MRAGITATIRSIKTVSRKGAKEQRKPDLIWWDSKGRPRRAAPTNAQLKNLDYYGKALTSSELTENYNFGTVIQSIALPMRLLFRSRMPILTW
jgi:hypothetical protein